MPILRGNTHTHKFGLLLLGATTSLTLDPKIGCKTATGRPETQLGNPTPTLPLPRIGAKCFQQGGQIFPAVQKLSTACTLACTLRTKVIP